MTPKIAGCCSKCDIEVFEVVSRDPETRQPRRVGPALDAATRATFVLMNGSRMDLTFCTDCAGGLSPADFSWLWRRVMLSWTTQDPGHAWAKSQVNNGIVGLLSKQPMREVA